jgi:hypothetical protein
VLPRLTDGGYDLAFLDAVKAEYPEYLEHALRLVRPGGVIIADNVLWSGRVADPKVTDPDTEGLRAYARRIAADDRLDSVILTIGDGLACRGSAAPRSWRPDRAVTTTYMGGRRGPPGGPERPLRGLPGGRARPRPSPPDTTQPEDDQPGRQPPGNGDPPEGGQRAAWCGRCGPCGSFPEGAPPLRVIPGGAQAPPGAG